MPSYPSDVWDDEAAAWDHLEALGFKHTMCVIKPPITDLDHRWGRETREAINYLCGEWDWAYEP